MGPYLMPRLLPNWASLIAPLILVLNRSYDYVIFCTCKSRANQNPNLGQDIAILSPNHGKNMACLNPCLCQILIEVLDKYCKSKNVQNRSGKRQKVNKLSKKVQNMPNNSRQSGRGIWSWNWSWNLQKQRGESAEIDREFKNYKRKLKKSWFN